LAAGAMHIGTAQRVQPARWEAHTTREVVICRNGAHTHSPSSFRLQKNITLFKLA
jgi:hypothetical protein